MRQIKNKGGARMVSANVTSPGKYFTSASSSSKSVQKDKRQDVTFGFMLNNTNSNEEKVSYEKNIPKSDINEKSKLSEKSTLSSKGEKDDGFKTKKADDDFDNEINALKNQMDKEKKSLKELEISNAQSCIIYNIQDFLIQNEQAVKEEIADTLDISVDELDAVLNKLNITVWDLKESDNAKQLVMAFENVDDVSQFLVDNQLLENINQLSEKISNIVSTKMETLQFEPIKNDEEHLENNLEQNDTKPKDTLDEVTKEDVVADIKIKGEDIEKKLENMQDDNRGYEQSKSTMDDKKSNERMTAKFSNENLNVGDILRDLTDAIVEKTDGIDEAKIVSQIIDQINVNVKQGMTSLEIQLYPEHLGKVVVEVTSKDGILNAKIAAETENVKNAIEGQLTILKESLNNQGIKVESVEVTIAGHGFEENLEKGNERNNDANPRKRTVRKDLLNEINGLDTSVEITEEAKMEVIGNTVSYKA